MDSHIFIFKAKFKKMKIEKPDKEVSDIEDEINEGLMLDFSRITSARAPRGKVNP